MRLEYLLTETENQLSLLLPPPEFAGSIQGATTNEMAMTIVLCGQLPSGKNAVLTTRTGKHYAAPRFKAWREDALVQLRAAQVIPNQPIDLFLKLRVDYWPGDQRVRDVPGMLDALCHLLVYAGVLKDDGQIRDVSWQWQGIDRHQPRVRLGLEWIG